MSACDPFLFQREFGCDARLLHILTPRDFGRFNCLFTGDFAGARGFLGRDLICGQTLLTRDARSFRCFSGGNLSGINDFLTLYLKLPNAAILGNARFIHLGSLSDTRPFDRFACLDFGLLKGLLTFNFLLADLFFTRNTCLIQQQGLRHAPLFGLLARDNLCLFQQALTLDLKRLGFTFLGNARFVDCLFLGNAGALG